MMTIEPGRLLSLSLLGLALLLVACSSAADNEAGPALPQGPALVMVYTDN